MGKRACAQGKNGSKLGLDLNKKFRAWQTASDLSKQIGERPDIIRKNANTDVECNGYLIGAREPVPEDDVHPATKLVYRVEYADEQAVRRAKELEAEVDELRGKALELARAYDEIDHRGADQGETLIEYIRRVSSSVQIHKDMIAAQERSQAELQDEIERLESELHHAHRLLVRRKVELDEVTARAEQMAARLDMAEAPEVHIHSSDDCPRHAHTIKALEKELEHAKMEAKHLTSISDSFQDSLSEMHDRYLDLLDKQSRRGLVRRVARRVLEVVL